ncbi:FAD-dependent oxidoreductase [Actinoplanes sp. NPDC026619]|uniref:FAD-dependent oxidoreductase n=1 Tax=Actinoplanes sp. NPDC026619 TaxID=3155798 RepID=UPI0033F48EE4
MKVAVVGAGIVGLAASFELIRAGHEVDCYDSGTPMGARSSGSSRIFRVAHTRPALVDWAMRSVLGWREWSGLAKRELVGSQGLVISGDARGVQSAMDGAQAGYRIADATGSLPTTRARGPFFVDDRAGVIDVDATADFLFTAARPRFRKHRVASLERLGDAAILHLPGGGKIGYDAAVVAAGAGNAELAADLKIELPTDLIYNFRFTFQLKDPGAEPACWLDWSEDWKPGFRSYGHSSQAGRWAVGGRLAGSDDAITVPWGVAHERAGERISRYIEEFVTACEPGSLDTISCNAVRGLGDGVGIERDGPFLFVWGENLFKLAPQIANFVRDSLDTDNGESELGDIAPLLF